MSAEAEPPVPPSGEDVADAVAAMTLKGGDDDDDDEDNEAEEGGAEGGAAKKKKKKKKNKKKKKKGGASDPEFDAWAAKVIADTSHLVEGVEDPMAEPEEFENYDYSGDLRAAYVTKQATVTEDGIVHTDYSEDGIPTSEEEAKGAARAGSKGTIETLNAEETERLREVCKIAREVMDAGRKFLRVGVTGDEIDRIIHAASVERGAYPSPLNYHNFPKVRCPPTHYYCNVA